ncbi:hypothetical protein [Sphaerochaeta sp. S2]
MAVMNIRTGDDGTEGNAAVSNIQMQLVALPIIELIRCAEAS